MNTDPRTLEEFAYLKAHGHVVEALAHDDLETTGLVLSAIEPAEWHAALMIVREERDRMAALLTDEQRERVKAEVRDWSRE